jgi:hypothetical protein
MQTRSQTKQVDVHAYSEERLKGVQRNMEFAVDIDFDESSRAWRANKIHMGDGHFAYTDVPRNNLKNSVWCPIQEDSIESLPPRRRRSPERYSS